MKSQKPNLPDWMQHLLAEFLSPPAFLVHQAGATASQAPPEPSRESLPAASGQAVIDNDTATRGARGAAEVRSAAPGADAAEPPTASAMSHPPRPIPQAVVSKYDLAIESRHPHEAHGDLEIWTDAKGRRYAAKRSSISPAHCRAMAQCLRHAKQQGFTKFAPFVTTATGASYVRHGDFTYYVTEWVSGQPANFALPEHVAQTAYTLAQFHEATRRFESEWQPDEPADDVFGLFQARLRDLRQMCLRADRKKEKDTFDQLLLSLREDLQRDAGESLALLEDRDVIAYLEEERSSGGWCHLDVIPANCLYTPQHQVVLIDFELARKAPRALDMAHLLRRSLERGSWDGHLAYACFLHFDAVRAIAKEEYRTVEAILRFPYLPWRIAHARYHFGADPAQLEALQRYAMQEEKRHAFLRSLREQVEHLGE
ncbi:phosphotransferase [Alicyclobacillus vulcanalis]|uniref:Spore coat protein, CotS family n=1 Tax=Alicyclobacillus vulcanalis TaxID=252246 RepID=A0A1N7NXP2_9BACL|nr:phosphotransferase [Alicyclobacillus vulcanalis]SIT03051.1 spore coat protein, CotS family [Alicyclobacillus vulcanalis]